MAKKVAKKAAKPVGKLTQAQVVTALADNVGMSKKEVKGVLDALCALAVKQTKKNGVCIIPGIGRLVLSDRKARMGRNPATGETIRIAAKKVVKFRVAKAAKDAIAPPRKKRK